jgi:hypothetical protein
MFGRCRRWGTPLLLLVILALVAGMGCRKELPELFDRNNPPETYITSAPVESLFDSFKVQVHWHGEDRDGEIAYFLWAWTDSSNAWYEAWNPESNAADRILREGDFNATHLTTRTDSTFILQSNEAGGMSRDLTFSVTAVDDQGRRDPVPARLYFNTSVDRRPSIDWLDEPYGELDPGVTWVGNEPETLSAGAPFACAFTGRTENGFVKGYQWNFGLGTLWFPLVSGQTGWTYQDPEMALLDTIRLDFANDILGADVGMTSFYDDGVFRVKGKCIDQAGVESAVSASPGDLKGVIVPILNRDPDTRLREDLPAVLTYTTYDGIPDTLYLDVERVDTGVPGHSYRINEPVPWGQDVRLEVHLQGWDVDDPLVIPHEEIRTDFQLAYTWKIKNLDLLDVDHEGSYTSGASTGRYPPGGQPGQSENLGLGYFGESGWHFQMNLGPMDYVVKGYALDHFGRVDGTPMTLELQGGFTPSVDSIILLSKYVVDDVPSYSTESVNLSELPEGETVHIDIGGKFYLSEFEAPLDDRLSWDPDTYTATFQPVEVNEHSYPVPILGRYQITFRIYGHDDLRNGDSAQLAGIIWDLFDSDLENNAGQFTEDDFFDIDEGGYIKTWQYMESDDTPHDGFFEINFAVMDTIFTYAADGNIQSEDTPIWLGEKQLSTIFRNTYPFDSLVELIETGQQGSQSMGPKGRSSERVLTNFDIQYRDIQ